MSANTETTGADRTKCKAWCGVPFRRSCGFPMYFEHGEDFNIIVKDDEPMWCSPACRGARLPPIAASAANVERRKGQRWKWERNGTAWICELISGSGYAWNVRGCGGDTGEGFLIEADWTGSVGATMTLLADAPPEPAKPTTPKCESFCRPGLRCKYCTTEVAPLAPPAQEAPKAAPVCVAPSDEDLIAAEVGRQRQLALSHERSAACHGHWPTKRAEGLIDRRLAADWVEDCLGDVR